MGQLSPTTKDTAMQKIIQRENRAVVINVQGDSVWANLYVNARNGLDHASICPSRWSGRTVKGSEKWAEKMLSR